jgi:hypothetical protein
VPAFHQVCAECGRYYVFFRPNRWRPGASLTRDLRFRKVLNRVTYSQLSQGTPRVTRFDLVWIDTTARAPIA